MIVAFRVDGSTQRGMGHVMRCSALAEYLKEQESVDSLFLMKQPQGMEKVRESGYPTKKLEANAAVTDEVKETLGALRSWGIKILVTDLLTIDEGYLLDLKNNGVYLISIDELGNAAFHSDIVINGSVVKKFRRYNVVNAKTKYYLGPDYMILRKNFAYHTAESKPIKKQADNLLVTFGGGDLANRTMQTVTALKETLPNFSVTVIVGSAYKPVAELKKLIKDASGSQRFTVKTNATGEFMVDAMQKADLAVCGGGITLYELATLGVPAITVCEEDFENEVCRAFAKRGFCMTLGKLSEIHEHEVAYAVMSLANSPSERAKMSEVGRKLVDGKGLLRVSSIIMEGLRSVNAS